MSSLAYDNSVEITSQDPFDCDLSNNQTITSLPHVQFYLFSAACARTFLLKAASLSVSSDLGTSDAIFGEKLEDELPKKE